MRSSRDSTRILKKMTEQVTKLLKDYLEEMTDRMLTEFKWYLSQYKDKGSRPIQKSQLENTTRTETVDTLVQAYGESGAVVTMVDILYRMKLNDLATQLAQGKTCCCSQLIRLSSSTSPRLVGTEEPCSRNTVVSFPSNNREKHRPTGGGRSTHRASETGVTERGDPEGTEGSVLPHLSVHISNPRDAAVWTQLLQGLRATHLEGESLSEMPALRAGHFSSTSDQFQPPEPERQLHEETQGAPPRWYVSGISTFFFVAHPSSAARCHNLCPNVAILLLVLQQNQNLVETPAWEPQTENMLITKP